MNTVSQQVALAAAQAWARTQEGSLGLTPARFAEAFATVYVGTLQSLGAASSASELSDSLKLVLAVLKRWDEDGIPLKRTQ